MGDSTVDKISDVAELNEMSEFLQDENVDRAISLLIRVLFEKGRIPSQQVKPILVELQGLSALFALKATYFATIGRSGSIESQKKNIYMTLKEHIGKLVDALKYIARVE